MNASLTISRERIAAFCREHGIRRLAVYGSALREDFGPDSDVDVLVEFEPDRTPGLLGIARLERELSSVLGGRNVDLRTPEDLSRYFRQSVIEEAEVQYAQDDAIRLRHMLDAAQEAMSFAQGRNRADLGADRQLVLALVKAVEIIGEAAYRLSPQARESLPEMPWDDIIGMRHRLVHAYFDINLDVL